LQLRIVTGIVIDRNGTYQLVGRLGFNIWKVQRGCCEERDARDELEMI
jgi:hypothetical protein